MMMMVVVMSFYVIRDVCNTQYLFLTTITATKQLIDETVTWNMRFSEKSARRRSWPLAFTILSANQNNSDAECTQTNRH